MDPAEQRQLLAQVRGWFSEPSQVTYYRAGVAAGPTDAEGRLLRHLPTSGSVLDVGCGAGRIAFTLADRGYDVTGVDVSAPLLDVAGRLGGQRQTAVSFLRVEDLALPFEPATFDAAVAFKVHCYVPSRALRRDYLREIGRVLRPGAPLLLTSYVVPSQREAEDAIVGDRWHPEAARRFRTLEALDTFCEGRGFVHWFTEESLHSELADVPGFTVENLSEDPSDRLLRYVVLRRLS